MGHKKQQTPRKFPTDTEMKELALKNRHVRSDYFDEQYSQSLEQNVFRNVSEHYFRAKFIGFNDLPKRNDPERPLIFATNHSGMAFPWDAIMFNAGYFRLASHHPIGVSGP